MQWQLKYKCKFYTFASKIKFMLHTEEIIVKSVNDVNC